MKSDVEAMIPTQYHLSSILTESSEHFLIAEGNL